MKPTIGFLAMAAAASLIGCTNSMMSKAPDMDRGTGLSSIDQPFVRDASNNGAYEMAASKIALTKSSNPEVRKLAQRLIEETEKSNAKLLSMGKEHGEPLSAEPSFDQEQKLDQLRTLDTMAFDAEYLRQMEQLHRDTIAEYKSESQYGQDKEVRSFSEKSLPKLEANLREIRGELGPAYSSERD